MALEEVNLEQQSAGSPFAFTLDLRNTTHTPAQALIQFQELAAAGVKIVIGPQSSAEMLACKEFADTHDILLISPSSTASSLAFARDNLLRFCPDDTYEAAAIAALLQADGITAIVPIWREDAGNQGLRDSTVRIFAARGGAVYAGTSYPPGETNFSRVVAEADARVTTALREHPGKVAVCLAGFDEVVTLFKVARTNDVLSSVKWYGGDGLVQSQLLATDLDAARFAAERGYPCPIFGLDERYRATWQPLAKRIKFESGHNEDVFTLAAYDAFRVAVEAYRLAGDEASFATVKAAFGQSASDHVGATGSTALNTAGDRDGGAFDFWSLKPSTNGYVWYRSASFQSQPGGNGTIIRLQ
jgi:branched-chain amino acid transport system substrate-binding protein